MLTTGPSHAAGSASTTGSAQAVTSVVLSFGRGDDGQLGQRSLITQLSPVIVAELPRWARESMARCTLLFTP
jgi:hypothetical protein